MTAKEVCPQAVPYNKLRGNTLLPVSLKGRSSDAVNFFSCQQLVGLAMLQQLPLSLLLLPKPVPMLLLAGLSG